MEVPEPSNDRLLVAICTYNEIQNLPTLYQSVREHFPGAFVLVVDDGSPDGTGPWCDVQAREDPRFSVIHRSGKLGLGSATVEAFRFAIANRIDFILTLDGDWSHDPADAVQVVQRVSGNETCQLCIGSRYVSGGQIVGWPMGRRIMSLCINVYTRWMLGISTRDCSSAFRCYRVKQLSDIDLSALRGKGYAYLEEILWYAKRLDWFVDESPITFTDRVRGQSKINASEAFLTVALLFRIFCSRITGQR